MSKYQTNTLQGAFEVALVLLTAPLSRLWYNRWGATSAECKKPLPGDELAPSPKLSYTRAITIHAPACDIWPWLVQIGQGRGGLYSYEGLENLVGCDMHNADRILPECQHPAVGDAVLFAPEEKNFPGQVIVEIQPERALVMVAHAPGTHEAVKSASWAFVLEEQAGGATRLIARGRNAYEPGFANALVWHIVEPIAFVMERKMLRGIKARVEDMRR